MINTRVGRTEEWNMGQYSVLQRSQLSHQELKTSVRFLSFSFVFPSLAKQIQTNTKKS